MVNKQNQLIKKFFSLHFLLIIILIFILSGAKLFSQNKISFKKIFEHQKTDSFPHESILFNEDIIYIAEPRENAIKKLSLDGDVSSILTIPENVAQKYSYGHVNARRFRIGIDGVGNIYVNICLGEVYVTVVMFDRMGNFLRELILSGKQPPVNSHSNLTHISHQF